MIPLAILRKMDTYELSFGDATVKVNVIDHPSGSKKLSLGAAPIFSGYEEAGVHHMEENPTRLCMPSHWTGETDSPEVVKAGSFQRAHALLLEKLSDFKCMLQERPVEERLVGVGYQSKCAWVESVYYPRLLLLCGGSRFLMIDLKKSSCSDSLRMLLTDETICFVGLSQKVADDMMKLELINCKTFVEVGYLAARVLKKSSIQSYGLENLGAEVGIDVKREPVSSTQLDDWAEIAMFLSEEQIKCVIHDVYYSFIIGHELLGML